MSEGTAKVQAQAIKSGKAYQKPRTFSRQDTENGMSPEERRAVSAHEVTTRGKDVEYSGYLTKNGQVRVHTDNKKASTRVDRGTEMGGITTHNHPGSGFNDTTSIGANIGTSLSGADWESAAYYGDKRMRAVAKGGYTYDLHPRQGKSWGDKIPKDKLRKEIESSVRKRLPKYMRTAQTVKTYADKYEKDPTSSIYRDGVSQFFKKQHNRRFKKEQKKYESTESRYVKQYGYDSKEHRQYRDRMLAVVSNSVNRQMAKDYDLVYTRRRTHTRNS